MEIYNLLMSADENLWDTSPADFQLQRVFESTDDDLKALFRTQAGGVSDEVMKFPCLFSYEFPHEKDAFTGKITKIEQRGYDVRIHFIRDENGAVPFKLLRKLTWELGFDRLEAYRHHWALKAVDLPTVLNEAGLTSIAPSVVQITQMSDKLNGNSVSPDVNPVSPVRKSVFISYSHQDEQFLSRLLVHLKGVERYTNISAWSDAKIDVGGKWKDLIKSEIEACSAAIMIISADFIASDFISENELPPLLQSSHKKGTRIIPVIAKPCLFTRHPDLSAFQSVNDPNRSLILMSDGEREEVYSRIAATVMALGQKTED